MICIERVFLRTLAHHFCVTCRYRESLNGSKGKVDSRSKFGRITRLVRLTPWNSLPDSFVSSAEGARMVLLSSLLWWELGTSLPGPGPGEWLSFWRVTSKQLWFWCQSGIMDNRYGIFDVHWTITNPHISLSALHVPLFPGNRMSIP